MRSSNILLLLALAAYCTVVILNAQPIVKISDPSYVSHKLKLANVTIGINNGGGGYLNFCSIDSGANIVSTGYGRGWQGSLRDRLHHGRYNPTQAGFRDSAGTPVKILKKGDRLIIKRFNMPLFSDPVFDFTEHEDLAPDAPRFHDMGITDSDGLDEKGKSQDDEVRSEFDFYGYYENFNKKFRSVIPILHFYQEYIYSRLPKAIKQFGAHARMLNGKKVLNPCFRVTDISTTIPGRQRPRDTDLSTVIFTAYGIRVTKSSGYTYMMYRQGGKWKTIHIKLREHVNLDVNFNNVSGDIDSPFCILANGPNPFRSKAIALYVPESIVNKYQLIGKGRKYGKVYYKEDRRLREYFILMHRAPNQYSIRIRYILRGMLAPDHTLKGVNEVLRNEVYILFGTPNEIMNTIKNFKHRLLESPSRGSVNPTPLGGRETDPQKG